MSEELEAKVDGIAEALKLLARVVGVLTENLESSAERETQLAQDIRKIIDEAEAAL